MYLNFTSQMLKMKTEYTSLEISQFEAVCCLFLPHFLVEVQACASAERIALSSVRAFVLTNAQTAIFYAGF